MAHSPPVPQALSSTPKIIAAVYAALLLSSCASFHPIAPKVTARSDLKLESVSHVAQSQGAWPQSDWWTAFGDPQLNELVRRALAQNPTLAVAQARLARAQASADLRRAAGAPQIGASADVNYGRQSENYVMPRPPLGHGGEYVGQGQAALNFGYDLDLWGRNAALIHSAEAQVKAASFDKDAARLALTTSIARAYAQLAAQYELQDILLATQEQRHAIRKLVDQRVANGLDTQVEVKQAEGNEAALQVEIAQLNTAIKLTKLQIAALAGDMPDAASSIKRPALAKFPFNAPATLPLDLLGRRPEVAAQRARVSAALGQSESAKADFYPNINLKGLVGFQSIGLGQLLNPGSLISSIGPAVHLPLFDGGRLQANYAASMGDVDAAIAQYNQSVLGAAQDVAEQLTRAADLEPEEKAARKALAAAQEAHRLAMLRYRGGLSPYLTVLTVETNLLAQRRVVANLQARRDDIRIALVRALGGGFDETHAAGTSGH